MKLSRGKLKVPYTMCGSRGDWTYHEKTRSRLGQRFPMRGFYYFMRVNVALANRGLPQMDLPPFDSLEAQLALPLLTRRLHLSLGQFAPRPSASTGRAPPRTG